MTEMAVTKNSITAYGDATGRITGLNHFMFVVDDLDESLTFYRDILGFKVVRTCGEEEVLAIAEALGIAAGHPVEKNYFFDIGNGELLTLVQVKKRGLPDPSIWAAGLWPGGATGPESPQKLDHLAFNVPSLEDLVWFQGHLRQHGVAVSEVLVAAGAFVSSIYFYDPSSNPLEIATFDWDNHSKWESHNPEDWLADPNPVPSLLSAK